MDPVLSGIVGTLLVFFLLSLGMPIAFSMMLVGFLGISFLSSVEAALPVLARTVYETSSHYPYTVIPLFVVMGGFAGSSGMTRQLYAAFDKWLRVLPGGLGVATIGACGAFAAICGSSVATGRPHQNTSDATSSGICPLHLATPVTAQGCVARRWPSRWLARASPRSRDCRSTERLNGLIR